MFVSRFLTLALIFTAAINNQAIALDSEFHHSRAKEFLMAVSKNGRTTYPSDLTDFLNHRITKSWSQGEEQKRELSQILNSQYIGSYSFYVINSHSAARCVNFFVDMVDENILIRQYTELNAYTGKINTTTQGYNTGWKYLKLQEYTKKFNTKYPNQDAIKNIKLEESRNMAQAILDLITSDNKNQNKCSYFKKIYSSDKKIKAYTLE